MTQWLTNGGVDQCPYCETDYHQETGYYCWNCDSPPCTTCVTKSTEPAQWVCPDCGAVEEPQQQQRKDTD